MSHLSAFESYIKNTNLQRLLEELEASDTYAIIREIKHFTGKEAEKRDQIVLDYFGEYGVKRITKSIVKYLLSPPKLRNDAKILDVGAGSGFFTVRVAAKIRRHIPKASFYAMDITPAMLSILARKNSKVTPFLGIAENIAGSVKYARKYLEVPRKFDAIFSTLTLHHCSDIRRIFRSIRDVIEDRGKAIIIDLCEHSFKEFREEMGDIHLGFNPSLVEENAKKFFPNVYVKRIPGIRCECSGKSAELFIAYLTCTASY
jgi:SAM-dependent methyltransferase